MRENDVAALVDGAGFQFGAGPADCEGGGAAVAIAGPTFREWLDDLEEESPSFPCPVALSKDGR